MGRGEEVILHFFKNAPTEKKSLKSQNYDVGYDFNKNLSEGRGLAVARY